jgi:ribosomal protein S18 acetylase RimI-like enzyme
MLFCIHMEIRQATNIDIEGILKLQLETAVFHRRLDANYEFREDIAEQFRTRTAAFINNTNTTICIALLKGELIGYAIGIVENENPLFKFSTHGMIEEAGVTAKYRTRGYGELIIASLLEWFRSREVEEVRLKVHTKNSDGILFWEKVGFETEMYVMKMKLS